MLCVLQKQKSGENRKSKRKRKIKSESFHFFLHSQLSGLRFIFFVRSFVYVVAETPISLVSMPGAHTSSHRQVKWKPWTLETVHNSAQKMNANSFEFGVTITTNWWQTAARINLCNFFFSLESILLNEKARKKQINGGYRFQHFFFFLSVSRSLSSINSTWCDANYAIENGVHSVHHKRCVCRAHFFSASFFLFIHDADLYGIYVYSDAKVNNGPLCPAIERILTMSGTRLCTHTHSTLRHLSV